MRNASCAARSCRPAALLVLAVLALGGLTLAEAPSPRPAQAPVVVSTVPADGTLQVDTTAAIRILFSEPMNASAVENNTFIQPLAPLAMSWPNASALDLTPTSPLANCTVYSVLVDGTNVTGVALGPGPVPNPWRFMTACDKPFLLSTSPADGAPDVRPDTDIVVRFSEPMDRLSIDLTFFPTNLTPPQSHQRSCTSTDGSLDCTVWTFQFTSTTRFFTDVNYTATLTARSNDTNAPLVAGLVPNPWTFHVNAPPVVDAPWLDRTGCLDARTSVTVRWNMTDNETAVPSLTVRLLFWNESATSPDWQVITGPRQGFGANASYLWSPLPFADLNTSVRVEVTDAVGAVSTNDTGWFRIDTGPPRVGDTFPRGNPTRVPVNVTITISFTEEVDRSSVEAAVSASPPFIAPGFSWPGNQTVAVTTAGLAYNTTYVVTVAATVRDTCGPGRMMGTPYTFSFTTVPPQPSAPTGLSIVSYDDRSVTLAWSPVTTFLSGEVIPNGVVVTYRVFRGNSTSDPDARWFDTTDTRYTDRPLPPATSYVYWVVAIVNDERSPPSAPAAVTTAIPFLTTSEGRLSLIITFAAILAAFVVGVRMHRRRKRAEADAALAAEIREILAEVREARAGADPTARRAAEDALQGHFRTVVGGEDSDEAPADPHLDGLYRALAKALVQSPEVDLGRGRTIVDGRLGRLADTVRRQGAAYRLLSEAEASVDSALFRGLPASARKALLLVYFYALEEYLSHRLRALVPAGSTLLLGERGHINVRRRGWESQWAGLTLGNLLYLMDHNAHFFVADEERWDARVKPVLREAVDARNRTAHPSREGPPLEDVRDLVYRAMPLVESILKKGGGVAA